uniref:Micro-fibrillar-associated protein 1 C-terminal domain-containing protein n=1 Tax=Chlamydomonas leiostraca TaxID=1034604 RepID=A0A7S0WH42_9CHLO|mmetsp:Transcript_13447/g.32886  ORF Transcript_13447/g.32886 Transcript_13447/m.32886 type:complete len:468 (+) Transcript_13447:111-1514(+)
MSKAAKGADKEAEKGRVDQTKVKRYWAGKAPEWAVQEQVQDLQIADREVIRTEVAAPVIVRKADPRLARLAATRTEDIEEARERHREIRAAEIVRRRRHDDEENDDQAARARSRSAEPTSGAEDDQAVGPSSEEPEDAGPRRAAGRHVASEEGEDEDEQLKRRQAVRERLLQQQREAEQAAQQLEEDEEEEEEEGSSEYETDSEDEAYGRKLLKPVFVPKPGRETIAEKEKQEQEEAEALEKEKKRLEERKAETRQLVAEHVAAEEQAARAQSEEQARLGGELQDVDTDDEEDQVGAYEAWKARELARIKRDREERAKQEREAAERERLKNMTEEERAEWERLNPKEAKEKPKAKWRFMQKYWHKGAYFQEAPDDARGTTGKDDIFDRDYSAPTGEDNYNKEILPKVMQVKNFGRSGRTKWTHLLAEDTNAFNTDDALLQAVHERRRKYVPGASSASDFSKPKKFKT